MKYTTLILLILLSIKGNTQSVNYEKVNELITRENFKIVPDNSLKKLAVERFIFSDKLKNKYDNEIILRYKKENDSTIYMVLTIAPTKGTKNLELPDSFTWCQCQFSKLNIASSSFCFDSERTFFWVPLNKAVEKLIIKSKTNSNKKIYFIILNNQLYDTYKMPNNELCIQDIMLYWKMVGETKETEYIYCFGVSVNSKVTIDRKDCISYPHDNLLKGKITWRLE